LFKFQQPLQIMLTFPPLHKTTGIIIILLGLIFVQPLKGFSFFNSQADSKEDDLPNVLGNPSFCLYMPTKFDITFNLVLLSIATLCSLALVVHFFFVKELRQKPGDLMIMLSIGELISTLNQIILVYNCANKTQIDAFSQQFGSIIENLINFYHISFCLFHLNTLKCALRGPAIPNCAYHIGPIFMAPACTYLSQIFTSFNSDICHNGMNSDVIISISKYTFLILLVANFNRYIHKYLPQCEKVVKARMHFMQYYRKYLLILQFIFVSRGILEASSSYVISHGLSDKNLKIFNSFMTISHIITGAMPAILTLARFNDPVIKRYWNKIMGNFMSKQEEIPDPELTNSLGNLKKSYIKKIGSALLENSIVFKPYIVQIQYRRKVQVVYSILSGIHYFWQMKKTNQLKYCVQEKKLRDFNISEAKHKVSEEIFKIKQVMKVKKHAIEKEVSDVYNAVRKSGYEVANGTLSTYAPKAFQEIAEIDDYFKNFAQSLDLKDNLSNILKSGLNKAGQSGEFFFFTNDSKFIIKTISNKELKLLLKILPKYVDHLKQNQSSLLTRIYGLFSFKISYTREKYHFIIMNNVNNCPKECIQRKYDLKGSTVGRRTVKNKDVPKEKLQEYDTLKDLDFQKYEKHIGISQCEKTKLLETLKKDLNFLESQGLMDYSLVLYCVNKKKCSHILPDKGSDKSKEKSSQCFGECVNMFEDPQNPGVYYKVGIIDYLTKFGWKKRFEIFFKKLIAMNPNHNISAQTPDFYAKRFLSFVEDGIFDSSTK